MPKRKTMSVSDDREAHVSVSRKAQKAKPASLAAEETDGSSPSEAKPIPSPESVDEDTSASSEDEEENEDLDATSTSEEDVTTSDSDTTSGEEDDDERESSDEITQLPRLAKPSMRPPDSSSLVSRLTSFLPTLKKANADLQDGYATVADVSGGKLEVDGDADGEEYIEMVNHADCQ